MPVNFEHDLILITAASGKICSQLLPLITQKWNRVRLVCNSQGSKTRLRGLYPNAEVLALDLLDRTHCQIALRGVAVCLYIGPSFHPHETQMGLNMIDAAVAASGTRADGRSATGRLAGVSFGRGDRSDGSGNGERVGSPSGSPTAGRRSFSGGSGGGGASGLFKHFVFSSVLGTQLRKLLHHDGKRAVEERLMESGLNYTLLQPAHFMQNFPAPGALADARRYHALFDPHLPFSFLDLADYAHALAAVLAARERHYFAQYPLCSTMPTSYAERVALVADLTGTEIDIERVPLARATDMLCEQLYGDARNVHVASRDAAERMLAYYDRHGLVGNPTVLELLLGADRQPTTMRQWIERELQEGR